MSQLYTYFAMVNASTLEAMSDGQLYGETPYKMKKGRKSVFPVFSPTMHMYRVDEKHVRQKVAYIRLGAVGKAIYDPEPTLYNPNIHVTVPVDESVVGRFGRYNVRVLLPGSRYGRHDCLVWDKDEPGIEFYLLTDNYTTELDGRGHFISRYYLKSLSDPSKGLCLDGGHPSYVISGKDLVSAVIACRDFIDVACNAVVD